MIVYGSETKFLVTALRGNRAIGIEKEEDFRFQIYMQNDGSAIMRDAPGELEVLINRPALRQLRDWFRDNVDD